MNEPVRKRVTALEQVRAASEVLGDVIQEVALTTSDTAVRHGLRQPPRGWLVVYATTHVTVCKGADHIVPDVFINIKASTAATVRLLFF